jgi:glyoxylase-like metal-dependent hydrolase (beta-lactamase superfamily II)
MGWRSMPSAISVSNSTAIRTYTESFPKQPSFPEIAPAGVAAASTTPDPPEHISTSPKPPFFPESAADPYASWKEPIIHDIFEPVTGTWQYIVVDPCTLTCAIIDPVLDYDPVTQIISTTSADRILALVKDKEYEVERLLETHAHADHLSASSYLQARLGESQTWRPPIGIGRRIGMIQDLFGKRYAIPKEETVGVFQRLFDDDEEFAIGSMKAAAIHLPGHTPDHLGYKIGGMSCLVAPLIHLLKLTVVRQCILRRLPLPRRHWHSSLRLPGR